MIRTNITVAALGMILMSGISQGQDTPVSVNDPATNQQDTLVVTGPVAGRAVEDVFPVPEADTAVPEPAADVGITVSTNEVPFRGTERLKALELKARNAEWLALRNRELEKEIDELRAVSGVTNQVRRPSKFERGGRLRDVERKATAYEGLIDKLERQTGVITNLTSMLEKSKSQSQRAADELNALRQQVHELTLRLEEQTLTSRSLKATVEQLLLGNFEYYEAKPGDTIETIAALPTIYGDANRASWIRQANRNRLRDLDNLIAGEVLVIPRFPASGRYDF